MLNESKGNMYSWVTHTWNAVKGECPHGCTYCYMKRWGKQKPAHLDEKELKIELETSDFLRRENNFIFVGSSCDLFADEIPIEWIDKTLDHCKKFRYTNFLFQTKNPTRLISFLHKLPVKSSICTTIETNRFYPVIMKKCPRPIERAGAMSRITQLEKFVTIEPVIDFDLSEMVQLIKACEPSQVNIGADSSRNNLPEPSKEKVLALIDELKKFTTIDRKTNLARLLK